MWIVHFYKALTRADASVALERENARLRAALIRAEQDFEAICDELSNPVVVRALPPDRDELWHAIRDRTRVARDEVRAALDMNCSG